jgi:two-component system KDP operon response regulator KdpE
MTAPADAPAGHAPLALVIEDEEPIRHFVRATLVAQGWRVVEAANAKDALVHATLQPPDVVLLDLGLPDLDGLVVTRRLRGWTAVPIIVISARGREADKVAALDAGADDYLTKPFSVPELLARLRVALRHAARLHADDTASVVAVGGLSVDLGTRRVMVDGREAHLTPLEFKLLVTLARHAGKVLTHGQLLREVWGPGSEGQSHNVRVFMAQLRRKTETDPAQPRYLLTEQGVGYRMAAE